MVLIYSKAKIMKNVLVVVMAALFIALVGGAFVVVAACYLGHGSVMVSAFVVVLCSAPALVIMLPLVDKFDQV